jgi:hypothetical protein
MIFNQTAERFTLWCAVWKSFPKRLVDCLLILKRVIQRCRGLIWQERGAIYRHHYQDVRDTYVWHTIEQSLEPLRIVVVTELERLANK